MLKDGAPPAGGQYAPMLIFLDPPEPPIPERKKRGRRRDYIALAAVVLAILVSLAGVCLVIVEASAGSVPAGHLTMEVAWAHWLAPTCWQKARIPSRTFGGPHVGLFIAPRRPG